MISNCNIHTTTPRIYTEIQSNCHVLNATHYQKLLTTARKTLEIAFAILSDVLILPGIGLLLLWMLLKPSFDPVVIKKDKIPILLLHGSGFNESQWIWGRFFLRNKNYGSIFSVSYDDGLISNDPQKGIDDCAMGKVRDKILQIQKITEQSEIILIGHSMGGLVASYYAEYGAPKDNCHVRHVISIGSPWQGTPVIERFLTKKYKEKRYQQMSPINSLREKLVKDALHSERSGKRTYYTIASQGDFIVPFPHSFLAHDLAHQSTFSSLGHFGIVVFPDVWKQVHLWLDKIYEHPSP